MENNYTDIQVTTTTLPHSDTLNTSMDILNSELALQAQYDELETRFLMKNYPPFCQKIHYYISQYLNSQDYSTSPIYAAYPSSATIDNMADIIYMEIKDDAPDTLKEFETTETLRYTKRGVLDLLIRPLLLNELYRRRMRKYIYTLCSSPPMCGYSPFK
ncbi:hypothetical protein [Cellulosilyticum sp. I15G10I2]|uniref:hypothetical protein n=1 Tax=Cellulosilyticum sp. I15G10I2 TaxID=1892843 RepID=UPI00085C7DF2|nr:hypothetical protein [Cellulosilyticum sp. I15G10I2]